MTDVNSTPSVQGSPSAAGPGGALREEVAPSGWTGWVLFAGIVMVVMGFFHVIEGITALVNRGYFLVGQNGLVVNVDFAAWGWTHVIFGVIVFGAGSAVMVGRTWARAVAIALAVLSAIINIGFLAAYPLWSTILIALDIIVIYALAVYGGRLKSRAT